VRRLTPLMVAFAVLLVLVAWREATRGSTRSLVEEAGLRPLAVEPFKADDVEKIEVTAPGGDKPLYTLEKENGAWRAVGAFRAPASSAAATKLVDVLSKAQGEFRSDDRAALEEFDLTHEREVGVNVIGKGGKTLAHVGVGASSMSRGAFVRNLASDDTKALAVADDLRGALGLARTYGKHEPAKPDVGHFHEKEFPQSPIAKPKQAEFVAPGRTVVFTLERKDEKDAAGEWKLAKGGPDAPLKKDGIVTAMNSLTGQFHPTGLVDPAKKAELGFDAPKYRTSFTGEDGVEHVVLGATDAAAEHWYVRIEAKQEPEVLYEASESDFHRLFPTGSSLLELPKPEPGKDGPTRLVVEKKDRPTIEITRKGTKPTDDWTLVAPKWPLEPRQNSLRSLGSSLPSVRISDYVDDQQMAEADTTVRFGSAGTPDAELAVLRFGAKASAGKDRLATLSSKPGHVYVAAENSIDRVAPEPLTLFETKILHEWRKDEVTAVRTKEWALVKDDAGWSIQEGDKKTAADTAAVEKWLDRVLAMNVTGIPTEPTDFKAVPVTLERKDGAPYEIALSKTKDGRPAAVLAGGFLVTLEGEPDLVPDRTSFEKKSPPETPAPSKPDDNK
jgi:uncharacterized protein DUF4340